jgi:DNA-binding IclR family transcriptional regulator
VTTLNPPATTVESYSSVAAVERALRVMALLAEARDGLTVTALADQLHVHRSLAFRLLASLVQAGYVSQHDPGPHYRLSLKLLHLTNRYLASMDLGSLFFPVLQRLANEVGEQVGLAIAEGNSLVRVARVEGHDLSEFGGLQVAYGIGSHPTLHASASGKAWISSLSEERALALVAEQGLPRLTELTITSLAELQQDLERTRARGFAACLEEEAVGVNAIAAPIAHHANGFSLAAVGALTVTAPTARLSRERLLELGPLVISSATELAAAWPPS